MKISYDYSKPIEVTEKTKVNELKIDKYGNVYTAEVDPPACSNKQAIRKALNKVRF